MKKIDEYKVPCEMIEDILPNYIDCLTCDTTNKIVDDHLKQCQPCREKLKAMRCAIDEQTDITCEKSADAINFQGVDFLRKVKRKGTYKAAAFALLAVIGCAVMLYILSAVVHPFAPKVQNVYRLNDGRIYFELKMSGKEAGVEYVSYYNFSDEAGDYNLHLGYSWLSLLQGNSDVKSKTYCFVRDMPESSVHYSCGNTDIIIWQKGSEIETAPESIETSAIGKENIPFWNYYD